MVVRAVGDLDLVTTPQLTDLLAPRLDSVVYAVVVDLSRVSFLCTRAMSVLVEAQHHADAQGVALRLVTGAPPVERALRAAGLSAQFATFPALGLAISEPVAAR